MLLNTCTLIPTVKIIVLSALTDKHQYKYASRSQTLKQTLAASWAFQLPMRAPYIFEYQTWLTCLLTNERADIILQTLRCHSDKRMTLCIPNNSEWQWFESVARTEFRNKRRKTLVLKTGKRRCKHVFLTDM